MNCRDRDLVETTIFKVVETEICRDWPKIVEIEIFPRLSLISGVFDTAAIEFLLIGVVDELPIS